MVNKRWYRVRIAHWHNILAVNDIDAIELVKQMPITNAVYEVQCLEELSNRKKPFKHIAENKIKYFFGLAIFAILLILGDVYILNHEYGYWNQWCIAIICGWAMIMLLLMD